MIYAGCRASEALHLRWEWIDWEGRRLTVRIHSDYNLKRKKERSIPLQQELVDILDLLRKDQGWIFEEEKFRKANTKTLCQRFEKLLRDVGLTNRDRSPHSCRHTFACLMLASREDVFTICRAMGHKNLTMTDHYSREFAGPRHIAESEGWKPGEIRLKFPRNEVNTPSTSPPFTNPSY